MVKRRSHLQTLDETKRDHICKHEKKEKETTSANIRWNKRTPYLQTLERTK
jgi:hypothetical protein